MCVNKQFSRYVDEMETAQILHYSYWIFFISFVDDLYECFHDCRYVGNCSNTFAHIRRRHGPIGFPWVCKVCSGRQGSFFTTAAAMKKHWAKYHPNIHRREDIIHDRVGMHYSRFPFLTPTSTTYDGNPDYSDDTD